MRFPPDLVGALRPVIEALERLQVGYSVGGSVASSSHGTPRATMDVDLVADLSRGHVDRLLTSLGDEFYASREMILTALRDRRAFNLIHRPTMMKVDVFPLGERAYDRTALERGEEVEITDDPVPLRVRMATAEDVILRKLEWSRRGDSVSEVQWRCRCRLPGARVRTGLPGEGLDRPSQLPHLPAPNDRRRGVEAV